LIEAFGDVSGVFNATKEELSEATGIGPVTALSVFELFHGV